MPLIALCTYYGSSISKTRSARLTIGGSPLIAGEKAATPQSLNGPRTLRGEHGTATHRFRALKPPQRPLPPAWPLDAADKRHALSVLFTML
jgi:hypothetical protein